MKRIHEGNKRNPINATKVSSKHWLLDLIYKAKKHSRGSSIYTGETILSY